MNSLQRPLREPHLDRQIGEPLVDYPAARRDRQEERNACRAGKEEDRDTNDKWAHFSSPPEVAAGLSRGQSRPSRLRISESSDRSDRRPTGPHNPAESS